jgi:hypothetical protein
LEVIVWLVDEELRRAVILTVLGRGLVDQCRGWLKKKKTLKNEENNSLRKRNDFHILQRPQN